MINSNSLQWKNIYISSISNNSIGDQLLLEQSVSTKSSIIPLEQPSIPESIETDSTKSLKKQWTFTAFFKAFWDVNKNPYLKEELEEQIVALNKELELLKKKCDLSNLTIINLEQKNINLQKI
jgi:hypothetical protein